VVGNLKGDLQSVLNGMMEVSLSSTSSSLFMGGQRRGNGMQLSENANYLILRRMRRGWMKC
jgi:hypothetical protein